MLITLGYLVCTEVPSVSTNKVDHVKRPATGNFIENAANPCKAAWSVINSNRNKTTAYKCPANSDELNQYFIEAVNSIVADMPNRSDEGKVEGDPRLTWSSWKRTSPDEIVGIVSRLKN